MSRTSGKRLLVEGKDDLYAIVQLMAAHIDWGNSSREWPVEIKACDGVENILSNGSISLEIKSSGIEILGVVVDADEDFVSRWNRLRSLCIDQFPAIPVDIGHEGLIIENERGKRLGIWIMPDNKSRGMMETFLSFLIPDHEHEVWRIARNAVDQAVAAGAKCRDSHADKSNIYTWLAWQDPPGQSFGTALVQKLLDPRAPHAEPFVVWFRTLFKL